MTDSNLVAWTHSVVERHRTRPGALLPILHDLQNELGYVPPAAIPVVAAGLNLSRAEVHGVVTFYHHFRQHPPGRHVLQLCQAESCQAMGSQALTEQVKARLGIGFHETTPDGRFTLEPAYCLGQCGASPALMVNGEVHARLTPEALDALLDTLAEVAP